MGSNPRDGAMKKNKCPLCGGVLRYEGFNQVECFTPGCKNYKPTMKAQQNTVGVTGPASAANWMCDDTWNFMLPIPSAPCPHGNYYACPYAPKQANPSGIAAYIPAGKP